MDLRSDQIEATETVEQKIAGGQRALLLAMATGTGKTRTAVSLMYRLVKARRFRRILFLVDRTTLGEQAFDDGFQHVKLEALQTFTDIYNVAQLGESSIEPETKVHIATVQSMVRRITMTSDDPPTTSSRSLSPSSPKRFAVNLFHKTRMMNPPRICSPACEPNGRLRF